MEATAVDAFSAPYAADASSAPYFADAKWRSDFSTSPDWPLARDPSRHQNVRKGYIVNGSYHKIESTLPSLVRPIMSLDSREGAIMGALKQSLCQWVGFRRCTWYKHPGLHFGDIHRLTSTYIEIEHKFFSMTCQKANSKNLGYSLGFIL